jgi:hypothetical protein
MNHPPIRHNQPIHDRLHPVVYRSIVGLTIWLVFSVWLLFDRGSEVGLNLTMITVFFVVVVGIPLLIGATWRHHRTRSEKSDPVERFRDWAGCEFTTWTGALRGKEAATQILLPIAAVSIGMTIFGLVFLFDLPHLT